MYEVKLFEEDRLGIKINSLVDEEGNIWFIGKEVASLLEYKDTPKAIKQHVKKENRKIMSKEEIKTYKNYSFKINNRGMTIINERGIYSLLENSKILSSDKKQELVNFVNKITGKENVIVLSSRFEIEFGQKLKNTFKPLNIEIESQKPMFNGKYRIDFYLPEFNLAIEYDEEQHNYQQEEDKQREEEIKRVLGCKFIRLDYKQDDNYNIGLVLKEIMGR